ncbi:MAG: tetratricopeptide repeat protein [Gemmatimonadetes bacterium]|nr:tetratricopeptide repeat protein [Gemmatimonadota bacterium]NNM03987.1 tetratricopeptide repeat protein [Gemmatimonadota bacterium]
MDRMRQLIHEAHRRSLWQVLSVYMVASWVALQVVEIITESAGLPDWAQPFALILLIIGLPVVLATAVVQEGRPGKQAEEKDAASNPVSPSVGTDDDLADPHVVSSSGQGSNQGDSPVPPSPGGVKGLFTWRNAIAGGFAAFGLLGIVVVVYFIMWSTGVGPVGSLAAQGVFEEGDAVVLAEFQNTSDDEALGEMVTEALRVDLAGSSIMTLVEPGRVQDALRRMGRTGDETLDAELAREVAIRDGFKAVVQGTVGSAGSGYLFVASLIGAESGSTLATFRESARGPDEVIDAIDKLSQDIREKAGESLRSIKSEEPLEDVTTSSLEALRKYAEADRLADQTEYQRAIAALEEAIDLDPAFAMAYRRLAVLMQNSGRSLSDQVAAATRAYELRDRLTERERLLAVAYYHNLATLDVDAEIRAYQTILEKNPDDRTSLNNLALALLGKARLDEAVEALQRAVNGPGASSSAYTNLPGYLAQAGRHQEAEEALAELEARYPGRTLWTAWINCQLAAFRGDAEATRAAGAHLLALPEAQGGWRSAGHLISRLGAAMAGNIQEANRSTAEGVQEMEAIGDWSQVLFLELTSIGLELALDREDQAANVYSRFDLNAVLDSIAPEVRDYTGVLRVLAALGEAEEVDRMLRRWQADRIPSSSGPVFEETRKAAGAILAGRTDPGQGLDALNELTREINCSGCYVWPRALFAERAERWPEARELYLKALEGGTNDFIGEPFQRIMAHERLGKVLEALGEPAKAAEHSAIFADYWADADPELQPRVRAARDRADALGAVTDVSEGG